VIPVERLIGLALFLDAPRDVVASLAAHARETRYATDEVIFRAGDEPRGWYVVLDGRVRVVGGTGARQHVIHTEGAGGTLGEVPLFTGGGHPAMGIATEPTVCALFTRSAIEAAMASNPGVGFLLLRRLALRVKGLVERLDGRSTRSVPARLAEFLLTRPTAARTGAISLGMTQIALAEEIGTVREMVSRELRALERRAIVESLGGGRYRLLDAGALRRIASGA
jgi:CRP/FNR family transcriptional regulator